MRIEANTNIFRDTAILESVEETLQETDLSPDAIYEISEALESLDKKVSDFSNTGFRGRIQTAKKQLVDREISVILTRARDLEKSVLRNDFTSLAAKVDALKNSLEAFKARHGEEGYSFIEEAQAFLDCASEMIAHPESNNKALKAQLEALFENLSEMLSERLRKEIPPEEADLIFELFELAEALHHKQEIKNKLQDLKSRLKSKSQVEKIDLSQGNDEKLKTVLLEVGHEIAGKPFEGDTQEWFRELDQYSETPSFVFNNGMIQA
ncbi:MAG TPA: hypothetical protein VLG76_00685 [Rhabdochlamydiaceae bacterium]|nr:hypothetical protein [Rhabdochlamydiaceae bacterium]